MTQVLQTIDVAKRLGCSVENVRVLERSGKLSAMRTPSGQRLFDSTQVDSLASERESAKQQKQAARAA
jgi:DNA-binding transcriptional MerR regulator